MPVDVSRDELRELQLDYLASTRDTAKLMKKHGESLGSRKLFKTAFPVLLYLSHQLKGSGGSLGFPEITALATRMSGQLNDFLDDLTPRPSPDEMSKSVIELARELEDAVDTAEKELKHHPSDS